MISIKGLKKNFRAGETETQALNVQSLDIGPGEFVAIMGPSGSGKSTLLNIVGLLDSPSEGSCHFFGHEVANCNERQRADLRKAHLGFVFQNFNLIEELSVYENIELPLLYLDLDGAARKERIESAMSRLGIAHRRNHFPAQLSGGQQQRTAIARATVTNPRLLLADEPTGNLDSRNGADVMGVLKELNGNGTGVVMVTHSHADATYASRIINMLDGGIVGELIN